MLQILERERTYLYTPITDVKRRGFPGTRLVKMNSNLKENEIDFFLTVRITDTDTFTDTDCQPCVVALSEEVKSLGESAQFGVDGFCRDVEDTAVANSWGIHPV